jgi:hypothetical protein
VFPLKVTAPRSATVGRPFTAKVVGFTAKGKPHPLKGATVDGKRTDARGTVRIDPTKSGSLTVRASKHGYIRDEITVHVA